MKSRKTTQKFFDCLWTWVNFVERSCHATHHSQPVTELRISHKFSPVLSDISKPINNIRNFNPLISKFFIKVNSILPFTERCCKCLVLTGVLQGAYRAQKGYLQQRITGLLISPRKNETLHIYSALPVSLGWCRLEIQVHLKKALVSSLQLVLNSTSTSFRLNEIDFMFYFGF